MVTTFGKAELTFSADIRLPPPTSTGESNSTDPVKFSDDEPITSPQGSPDSPTLSYFLPSPPDRTPWPWSWQCHCCRRAYKFACTRRCLECGHRFCGASVVQAQKPRTFTAGKEGRGHGHCQTTFDWAGWMKWGEWRRWRAASTAAASTFWEMEDDRDERLKQGQSNCWTDCDRPNECHQARERPFEYDWYSDSTSDLPEVCVPRKLTAPVLPPAQHNDPRTEYPDGENTVLDLYMENNATFDFVVVEYSENAGGDDSQGPAKRRKLSASSGAEHDDNLQAHVWDDCAHDNYTGRLNSARGGDMSPLASELSDVDLEERSLSRHTNPACAG